MVQRRKFIRLVGGGLVLAAGAAAATAWSLSPDLPAEAIEAWRGPGEERDPRRRAVACAITAPNPHNRQPWLVDLRRADAITLYCDTGRLLPHTDPFGRQIFVGHGAFLELLTMALAAEGVGAEVTLWPDGEAPRELADWKRLPVAHLRLTPLPAAERRVDPLYAQVLKRRTPKVAFDTTRAVDAATLQRLSGAAAGRGVRAGHVAEAGAVQALRRLCIDSAAVEISTPRTALESLRLLRIGPDEILAHRDGISLNDRMVRVAAALGQVDRGIVPEPGSAADRETRRRFDTYSRTAMAFTWIATDGNRRTDQVNAGRAYVRQQLDATRLGVAMHPMSQALQEFAEMAPHLETAHRLLLGRPAPRGPADPTLQMMCRVGHVPEAAPATPRRPLGDFFVA